MYQGTSTPKVGAIFEEIRVLLSSSKTKALIQKSLGDCYGVAPKPLRRKTPRPPYIVKPRTPPHQSGICKHILNNALF